MDATQAELTQLRALVSDLSTRVARLPAASVVTPSSSPAAASVGYGPYWSCVSAEGLSFGAGTDWAPQFDDLTATKRVAFHIATATGSFEWGDARPAYGTLFRIVWDNPGAAYVVNASLAEGVIADTGVVQVQFNGMRSEYSVGHQMLSLDVKTGRNTLVLIRPHPAPDSVQFCGVLFDGVHSSWVAPK